MNHINSINHKIIRNCPEPPSTRQNHQESARCTSTCHIRLERCLFQFFIILNTLSVKSLSVINFVGIIIFVDNNFHHLMKNFSVFTDEKLMPTKNFTISGILQVAY